MNRSRAAPWAAALALLIPLSAAAPPPSAWAKGKDAPERIQHKPGVPDRKLQKQIDAAIAKGAAWLRSKQKINGMIGGVAHSGAVHYKIGTTALAGLALLAAGDLPKHKRDKKGKPAPPLHVDKALEYCRKQDELMKAGGRTTYDTGVLLMFVTEYYRTDPKGKKGRKKHTVTKKAAKNPCEMPQHARDWIRDMAASLANSREPSNGWGYPKPREDLSNTQYALLGLRAARDCGGKVPREVFLKIIERMLATQQKDGPKMRRTIGGEKKGDPIYVVDSRDRARGWSYLESPMQPSGSMTTAGIACLAIAHDALTRPEPPDMLKKRYPPSKQIAVQQAIQDGFAWLEMNFTVERNPGPMAPPWHYYYLYGLERAAVFCARTLIGRHDWYLDGARYLVGRQKDDGRWSTGVLGGAEYEKSDVCDTAWAILFLKKATRPMKPIPMPVITK